MLWVICTYLLFVSVKGAKETPREDKDRRDDYWFHFVTRPDIQVPKYEVHIYDEDKLAPGMYPLRRSSWINAAPAMRDRVRSR